MGAEAPMSYPALAVARPIMTCTKWQVGCRSRPSLLPASTTRLRVGGRSAIQPGSLTSRSKNVGPKGHTRTKQEEFIPILPRRGNP